VVVVVVLIVLVGLLVKVALVVVVAVPLVRVQRILWLVLQTQVVAVVVETTSVPLVRAMVVAV
jgi:hypothetical protein